MDFQLTKNQQQIFDLVEHTDKNIFGTGKPGTGKSVLIRALVETGKKHYVLAAPTGLAAINIGGKTLHSIFRLPASDGIIHPTFNNFTTDRDTIAYIKYKVNHLIIDEVSMVRADMFDFIDRLMRYAKEKDEPFGGTQIIIVGDFYQLPPVANAADTIQLKQAGYDSPFVFSSKAFETFHMEELSEVLRQKGDPTFIKLLHSARTGDVTDKQLAALNKLVGKPDDLRIKLTSTNKIAELVNQTELDKIQSQAFVSNAVEFGTWPAYPAEKVLRLKVGAQVMVKMNKADRPQGHRGPLESKVVNGTLAIIREVCPAKDGEQKHVKVELRDGTVIKIYVQRWERKIKEEVDGKWSEVVVAAYEQLPLALAWAISIHKSQGQSFDYVHVDANKIFAPGQLYVALSRARSMAGLSLNSKVTAKQFFANKDVKKFFKQQTQTV